MPSVHTLALALLLAAPLARAGDQPAPVALALPSPATLEARVRAGYRVCTVPTDGDRITARAPAAGLEGPLVTLQVPPSGIARRGLGLRAAPQR